MVSYEFKANLTTILATYLIPTLVGYGVSVETANAITGIIVTLIILVFTMLNERYTSSHLTVDENKESDVEEESFDDLNEGC